LIFPIHICPFKSLHESSVFDTLDDEYLKRFIQEVVFDLAR